MKSTRLWHIFGWPITGSLFVALWAYSEYGRMSYESNVGSELSTVSWIAALGLVGIAIAIVRASPLSSGILAVATLVIQFFFAPAQFGAKSWPVYFGYALIVIGFSAHAPVRYRKAGLTGIAIVAALIAIMLALPVGQMPFWLYLLRYPSILLSFLAVSTFVALGFGAISWLIGAHFRSATKSDLHPVNDELDISALSERERDIFRLAAQGLSNSEIASIAFISEATVKSHMTRILSKIGLTSRAQLVAYAWRHQFVTAAR